MENGAGVLRANTGGMRGTHPERFLETHVERDGVVRRGERIVVACSGGPDSVALAGVLYTLAGRLDLSLTLAYVHHGTRRSAWQDECVVLRLAATFGVRARVVQLDGSVRSEADLRDARYAALTDVARRDGATAVATAHHAGDQTETVLLALFRGSGPLGLAGIEPRRPLAEGVDVIRPLLRVAPETLRDYCQTNVLPYAIDPTNANRELRRNAVRTALEALRPAFPGLDEAVARAADLVAHEAAGSPRGFARRRIREALQEQGELRDVDFTHVEEAVRAIERGSQGRFFMKKGVTLAVGRGKLSIRKDS